MWARLKGCEVSGSLGEWLTQMATKCRASQPAVAAVGGLLSAGAAHTIAARTTRQPRQAHLFGLRLCRYALHAGQRLVPLAWLAALLRVALLLMLALPLLLPLHPLLLLLLHAA